MEEMLVSKIIFEKFDDKDKELKAWTKVFDTKDELLDYMTQFKLGLLGQNYKIVIREIKN